VREVRDFVSEVVDEVPVTSFLVLTILDLEDRFNYFQDLLLVLHIVFH